MSDHKRCRACGRIEDVVIRQEHEERMQGRIDRHRAIHAVPASWCPACRQIEKLDAQRQMDASIERVIQHQRRMARLQETNRAMDTYELEEVKS